MTSPGSVRKACQAPPLSPKYEGEQTPTTFPPSLTLVAMQLAGESATVNGPRFLTKYVIGVGAGAQGLGLGEGVGAIEETTASGLGVGVGLGVGFVVAAGLG